MGGRMKLGSPLPFHATPIFPLHDSSYRHWQTPYIQLTFVYGAWRSPHCRTKIASYFTHIPILWYRSWWVIHADSNGSTLACCIVYRSAIYSTFEIGQPNSPCRTKTCTCSSCNSGGATGYFPTSNCICGNLCVMTPARCAFEVDSFATELRILSKDTAKNSGVLGSLENTPVW